MCLFRGECTDTLRRRITELETECKKLTMDIKLKEDQIRELELKVQVNIPSLAPFFPLEVIVVIIWSSRVVQREISSAAMSGLWWITITQAQK